MLRYAFIAAFAVFMFFSMTRAFAADAAPAADSKAEGIIGTIMEVEGKASVIPAGQKAAKPLALKDSIHMNDVIETGAKSKVFVLFIDNTQITLSENTKLTVNQYVFDPDNAAANKASYNVLNGTFQYLSGLIAKKKDPDVNIETPYGTIGIRGTKLWAGNLKDTYGVHVEEGAVQVKNDAGKVIVNKGQGTTLKSRKAPPPPASPFTNDQMQFIAQTVLLANAAQVFERIAGFQGQQKLLQGQFKSFLKFKGMPGNMKNLVPGGDNLPFGPGEKNNKRKKGGGGFGGFPGAPGIPGLPGGF
jgi:hypothetical protein